MQVLRMSLPIGENLSELQESIVSLSSSPQLHFVKNKIKIDRIILNLSISPYSPCLGSLGLLSIDFIVIPPLAHVKAIPS